MGLACVKTVEPQDRPVIQAHLLKPVSYGSA